MIEYSQKEIDLKFANAVDYMGAFMPNLINFYALFTKRVNNKIKTLRICCKTDITPVFEYNEKWICEIEPHAFNMFLVIELYRFISHHCTRGKEFVGENAFIASTALCNAKELSKFIMGAPQEILDLFAKDVPNKKIVEEHLHQKISNNDWYFENVYDLLTQNQQQQQQEQDNQQSQQSQNQDGEGEEAVVDAKKYIRRERYYGTCRRAFYVGEEVTQNDIKAKYDNGILQLFVPKIEPAKVEEEKKFINIEG